ncbi:MAG: RNA polymerase sigma-70 factor [Chitinophagaceae bacterium]
MHVAESHLSVSSLQPPEKDKEVISIYEKEIFIRHAFQSNPTLGCELLFNRYYSVLCSHVARFVYSKEVAEDIVGQVFCRFWENKVYLKINTSYRAYLFTSVRNSALNYLKSGFGQKKRLDLTQFEEQLISTNDPYRILQADELNKRIEKAILTLPLKCQMVFLMSRMEGKKNTEIAAALDISLKAIEKHISRALNKLKSILSNEYMQILFIIFLIQFQFSK